MNLDLFSQPRPEEAPASREVELGADEPSSVAFPVYTVAELNRAVGGLLRDSLGTLWIKGEISGWKRYERSGHCYFSLRDAEAQVRCVMFRGDAVRLPTEPEEGMEVRVLAEPGLYEPRGEFQLVARHVEAAGGDGLWRLAFDRLRARLERDGLLAAERKRPIPTCPERIGVVTSADGAALRDIVHVIGRRAPWVTVLLRHARVQGDGAAEEIAGAIEFFARTQRVDVLIVGRGGGSTEDLWAFNEERVARAIAASPFPVISAVGHETDVSIADLVADARAPTPSAAAERAVPDRDDLTRRLGAAEGALRGRLREHARRYRLRTERAATRLQRGVEGHVRSRRERVLRLAGKLEALSPLGVLARGYAVPLSAGGRVLRRTPDFPDGLRFRLRVEDGEVGCRVEAEERP